MLIGDYKIPCLLMPDGKEFRIAVSQTNSTLKLTTPNNATKAVKALLPKGSQLLQKVSSNLHPSKVNTISLLQFEHVVLAGVQANNPVAIEIAGMCIGNTLTARAHDAFGIKYDAEEREAFLKARALHKEQYRPLFTDWASIDGCEGLDYVKRLGSLKKKAGLPGNLGVDKMTSAQQKILNQAETYYNGQRSLGNNHKQAMTAVQIIMG